MAMYVNFKDKGIEFAKQAVTEDEACNYEKAWQLYCTSLEYFNAYLKYEKNDKLKASVMAKVGEGHASAGALLSKHAVHHRQERKGCSSRCCLEGHCMCMQMHGRSHT